MAATNPMRILCDPSMMEWPAVQELMAQGHEFVPDPGLMEFDAVMGPTACLVMEEHEKLLDYALKGVRARATVRHRTRREKEKADKKAEQERKKAEKAEAKRLKELAKKTPADEWRAELFG